MSEERRQWLGPEVTDYQWRRYVDAGYQLIEAEKAAYPCLRDGRMEYGDLTRLENVTRLWLSWARVVKGPEDTINKMERRLEWIEHRKRMDGCNGIHDIRQA